MLSLDSAKIILFKCRANVENCGAHQFYNYLNNKTVILKEKKKANYNNIYHASRGPFYFNFFSKLFNWSAQYFSNNSN